MNPTERLAEQRGARRMADLRNSKQGRRAVILANGSSLLDHDLSSIAPDVVVIGCNRSWERQQSDYHVIVEPLHMEDDPHVYKAMHEQGRLVVAGPRYRLPYGLRIDLQPAVRGKRKHHAFSFDLTTGAVLSVDGVGSVVYVCLQLAAWLGIAECHILGLDLCGEHFHGKWSPPANLAKQDDLFKIAAEALRGRMAVYVCGSPASHCTAFPKSDFTEVCG